MRAETVSQSYIGFQVTATELLDDCVLYATGRVSAPSAEGATTAAGAAAAREGTGEQLECRGLDGTVAGSRSVYNTKKKAFSATKQTTRIYLVLKDSRSRCSTVKPSAY